MRVASIQKGPRFCHCCALNYFGTKRLEQDKFKWPTKSIDECLSLSEQQFHWLLSGFDVLGHQHVNGLSYS
ncbi:MAG: IS66 family insertion sequence element accessory protein TnpB [Shewanella sp.]